MIRAYQALIYQLNAARISPKEHILGNECSDVKDTIKLKNMKYQLIPPHDHHHNRTEKAIQTFKNHFVAIVCGANKNFLLNLWCQLLRQAEHTLNILRPSWMTPMVSSYAQL
jgi:hypothetical protein